MTKRRRETSPTDAAAAASVVEFNTVFIDTSLDTHLAMLISSSDTASDFKKKVALEHVQCFPEMGEIQVHSVKVKRRSAFYHLSDFLLVWSAFHGVKKSWFLSVDASSVHACQSIRNPSELGTSSVVKIGVINTDDDCRGFRSEANRKNILSLSLQDGAAEKNAVSEVIAGPKVDKPVEKTTDSQRTIYSEEQIVEAESPPKKKLKLGLAKEANLNTTLGGDGPVKVSGVSNDQYDFEGRLVSGGISPPTMVEKCNMGSQNIKGCERGKENNELESMLDYKHSAVVSIMVPDSSAGLLDLSGGGGGGNTSGSKRKKKKVHKKEAKVQDTTDIEHIGEGERLEPPADAHKCDQLVETKGFSLNNDNEVMMRPNNKAPGQVDPNLALTEASLLQDGEKSKFSIVNPQKLLDCNGSKENNVLESKLDYEGYQDASLSGGACSNTPNLSTILVDAGGGIGAVKTDGKKKKKKVQITTAEVLNTTDAEQIGNGEMKKTHTETIISEGTEAEKGLLLEHDHEVILPSGSKAPDHADPDLALKEASIVRDAEAVVELDISSVIKKRKKKKREKKHISTSIENSGITEIHNGIKGCLVLPSPSGDHIPEETGKVENIRLNEGKDVQMKPLDDLNHDTREKSRDVNRGETDLEIQTRTEQTVIHESVVNENVAENTVTSASNCNADVPPEETENTIIESNQADKDDGNTQHGDRKAKKKIKKKKHTAADVQENSPVKDQQVGTELLAINETSIDFVKSAQEARVVDLHPILGCKSEEKVDKMHELLVNTDDLAENPAKGSDRINFKQHFVPDQHQNDVDSGVKVRKGTKSKRSSKKAKDNDLPSVNTSTELQNSIKSFENKKTGTNYYRKNSDGSKCNSTQNSDLDEISHHSLIRSSEAPAINLKDSSLSAPMFQNKNPSLDKPNPQKKILLAKSGAIFQDNSGESSSDENRIMHSNFSTLNPSDTSSMSGDSAGESELSHNSTSKGSNGAEGKCTSKLDLSASKDMTLEMIMRSSKRFKKAKEVASQSESQPMDCVPHTQ